MRKWTLKVVIALLVITSLACNFVLGLMPGQKEGPTPSANSEESAIVEEPTPVSPRAEYYDSDGNPTEYTPPPEEMVELLLAEVEEGHVELEEGVLELMRVLAGDGSRPAYSQGVEAGTQFNSGWGLSLLAHRVYQQSEDPELRAELERLHRRLAPPHDALMQYAVSAEEYQSHNAEG